MFFFVEIKITEMTLVSLIKRFKVRMFEMIYCWTFYIIFNGATRLQLPL